MSDAMQGKAALIAQVGSRQFSASWTSNQHRLRRLLAEFIGTFGLVFVLSAGAAILAKYGGGHPPTFVVALVLSLFSALWLMVAIFFLGDISAHFNPAMTLAFTLRRDMGWPMAATYWLVQFVAAIAGALLARAFFGPLGNLAATRPPHGLGLQSAGFEAILTFGLVLMVLGMANGPKLNGAYVPFAVAAYIMALGSLGGPFEGAAMNPARARPRRGPLGPHGRVGLLRGSDHRRDRRRGRGARAPRAGEGPGGDGGDGRPLRRSVISADRDRRSAISFRAPSATADVETTSAGRSARGRRAGPPRLPKR
jgi:glycerol uptake facilitator-like aquaporin